MLFNTLLLNCTKAYRALTLIFLTSFTLLIGCQTNTVNTPIIGALDNTHWVLKSLNGKNMTAPKNTSPADIKFDPNSHVGGFTGCNRFFGKSTYNETQMIFMLATTRMACGEANQKFEVNLMTAFSNAKTYRISNNILYLLDANNTELAQFTKQ